MDIFDFAMKMEKDGENFYRELAARTANKGLKNIFTMLANAEVVHYQIFHRLKEKENVTVAPAQILSGVKNVFEEMKEKHDDRVDVNQIEWYRKAQEIEKSSKDFYLKQAEAVQDRGQKEIFLKVADEEEKHFRILEQIIDFVSRPQSWLENAEWFRMEDN